MHAINYLILIYLSICFNYLFVILLVFVCLHYHIMVLNLSYFYFDFFQMYDRFGDPRYFVSYNGGNPMTVAWTCTLNPTPFFIYLTIFYVTIPLTAAHISAGIRLILKPDMRYFLTHVPQEDEQNQIKRKFRKGNSIRKRESKSKCNRINVY